MKNNYKSYEDLPLTLSVPEVAAVLGISRAVAYELVRLEGFPKIRIGNRIVVPKDKLIAWMDEHPQAEGWALGRTVYGGA